MCTVRIPGPGWSSLGLDLPSFQVVQDWIKKGKEKKRKEKKRKEKKKEETTNLFKSWDV